MRQRTARWHGFDSLSRETGSVIPSKYVDESYINNEYKGSVKVITESDAK